MEKIKDYHVFDIETKKTAERYRKNSSLGFGCGVIYQSSTNQAFLYPSSKVKEFIAKLEQAKTLVSYNGKRFDLEVIKPYTTEKQQKNINNKNHIDIFKVILEKTGKMIAMNNVAYHTFGIKKNGFGIEAPKMIKQGKIKQVLDYCKKDVLITNQIFRKLQKDGKLNIWFSNYGFPITINFN